MEENIEKQKEQVLEKEPVYQVKQSDLDKLVKVMVEKEIKNQEVEAETISYLQATQYNLNNFINNKRNLVFVNYLMMSGKTRLILCEVIDECVVINGTYYGVPPTSIWYDKKNRARTIILEGIPSAISRDLMFNPEAKSTYEQKILLKLALKGKTEALITILMFLVMGIAIIGAILSYSAYNQSKTNTNAIMSLSSISGVK